MKTKGISSALVVALGAVVALIASGIFFLEITTPKIYSAIKTAREFIALTVIDFVNPTKLYLKSALSLSTYQSSWDLGRKGGFENYEGIPFETPENVPYWKVFSIDYTPSFEDFKKNLESLTQSYLNSYIESMKVEDIEIELKNYTTTIDPEEDGIRVIAESSAPIKIKSDVASTVLDGKLNENYDIRIFELYYIAKENTIDVKGVVSKVLTNWNHEIGSLEKEDQVCPSITDEEVFEATTGKNYEGAKMYITEKIRDDIKSLEENLNSLYSDEKYSWNLKSKEIEVKITSDCEYDFECAEQKKCLQATQVDCTQCTGQCFPDYCGIHIPGQPTGKYECCMFHPDRPICVSKCYSVTNCPLDCCELKNYYSSKKSCDFDYYAYAIVKVSIIDTSKEYIVWDGSEANYKQIVLNFFIKGGNWLEAEV